MEIADSGLTQMADSIGQQYAGDETLAVRVIVLPLHDHQASEEAGRPIFKDVPHFETKMPGSREVRVEPVNELNKRRFARQFQAWQAKQQEQVEGTPLSEWPAVTRSQVEELSFFNIKTVEQLATMPDANAQGVMGVGPLKDKAKAFLEASKDQRASEELAALKAEMAALKEQLEAKQDVEKPRRGRPPKTE